MKGETPMSVSSELKESQTSYDLFKVATGETYQPYTSAAIEDHNLQAVIEWGTANLPGGFAAFAQMGAFQIAFRECLKAGLLQRDSAWLSRGDRRALFVKFNNA